MNVGSEFELVFQQANSNSPSSVVAITLRSRSGWAKSLAEKIAAPANRQLTVGRPQAKKNIEASGIAEHKQ